MYNFYGFRHLMLRIQHDIFEKQDHQQAELHKNVWETTKWTTLQNGLPDES